MAKQVNIENISEHDAYCEALMPFLVDFLNDCVEDDKGFQYEADGQFISSDDSKNTYFRRDEKGDFQQIEWFEHNGDDYVLMDSVIDTDGQVVGLVCQ